MCKQAVIKPSSCEMCGGKSDPAGRVNHCLGQSNSGDFQTVCVLRREQCCVCLGFAVHLDALLGWNLKMCFVRTFHHVFFLGL